MLLHIEKNFVECRPEIFYAIDSGGLNVFKAGLEICPDHQVPPPRIFSR